MKLLIVDDEKRFLETSRKILAKKGVLAETADSGEKALKILDESDIDVVVLDVKMPGMDGLSVLKKIKASHPLVEVVMLTGHATLESAVEGLKDGASDYLMKPCDMDTIIAKAIEAYEKRMLKVEKVLAGVVTMEQQ